MVISTCWASAPVTQHVHTLFLETISSKHPRINMQAAPALVGTCVYDVITNHHHFHC